MKKHLENKWVQLFAVFIGLSIAGQVFGGFFSDVTGLEHTMLAGQNVVWATAFGSGAVGVIAFYAGRWIK